MNGKRRDLGVGAWPVVSLAQARQKANLSYWIYCHNLDYRLFDEQPPGEDPPVLDRKWVEGHRNRTSSASDRMLTLLRELIRCDDAGKETTRDLQMAAGGCRSSQDLDELVRHSMQQGWTGSLDPNLPSPRTDTINLAGRIHVDEQRGKQGRKKKRAFVAMWFDPRMQEAYSRGIEPAIRDAGYEPVRIDRKEFLGKVDDEIVAEIRRSRFVVADFTTSKKAGARGGVYYEAGFAQGLGLDVIHTCCQDRMQAVHFDTNHFNHITWKKTKDLRTKLQKRIEAVLGRGPF